MDVSKFWDNFKTRHTFYNHQQIEKRGYATGIDKIVEIEHFDINNLYTLYFKDNSYIELMSIDEVMKYELENGKTIEQVILEEPEQWLYMKYHIRVVEVDENGNIKVKCTL